MTRGSFFAVAICGLSLAWTGLDAAQAPFAVTSSSFADGGMLTVKNAADDPMRMCGGQNISPALAWSNPPPNTKSYAVFLDDPEGLLGAGVSHWVAYNVPANVTSFAEGEMAKQSQKFMGGKGTRDNALYIGPCPPTGDAPHHYVFTVIATDLDPGALKAGMAKDEVMAALKGHMLKAGSLIGRYAR